MLQEEHSYLCELMHRGVITFKISSKSFLLLSSVLESSAFIKHKNLAALISRHCAVSFHLNDLQLREGLQFYLLQINHTQTQYDT